MAGSRARKRNKRNKRISVQYRQACKLDVFAKELGVYGEEYHRLTRLQRKSIVSTALTALKAA